MREQLEAFVKRGEIVLESGYVKRINAQGGTKQVVRWAQSRETTIEDNLPSQEEIRAVLLTARMFYQNNDRVSIGRIAKLTTSSSLRNEWKSVFAVIRKRVNDVLDSPSDFFVEGQNISNRRLFDVFLYGHFAHSTPDKEAEFNTWNLNPDLMKTLEFKFSSVLIEFLHAVGQLTAATKMELRGEHIDSASFVSGSAGPPPALVFLERIDPDFKSPEPNDLEKG